MSAYVLWRLATLLVRRLPLRASYEGAALLADLVFLCWREKRANTIDNMRHVLGTDDVKAVRRAARASFRNYGRYLVDFIRVPAVSSEWLEQKFEFDQWDLIDTAFAGGRGVIFVLMHFGNWDWGGALFSQRGYPLNVVAETFSHNRLNDMVVAARRASGMRVLPMEKGALPLVRVLRHNQALAILIDRPNAEHGIAVNFFGGPTVLPSGPARLALHTGARVIAVGVVRISEADDRLRGLIDADINVERTNDDEEDARALTEAILRAQERFIREFPEQWYMFRRMWPKVAGPISAIVPV
jgi:KDO2-lipid IV(A) lauroyltransferase